MKEGRKGAENLPRWTRLHCLPRRESIAGTAPQQEAKNRRARILLLLLGCPLLANIQLEHSAILRESRADGVSRENPDL